MPGCNDLSFKMASQLSTIYPNKIQIDPPDISDQINNKSKFRNLCSELSIKSPNSYNKKNNLPDKALIIKPVDSYSGYGISVIPEHNVSSIDTAIEKAKCFSRSDKYIVEDFIDGELYSYSCFIVNKTIDIEFTVKEFCIANPFAVDTSFAYPLNQDTIDYIRFCIEKIAKLSLVDGLIHLQFILNDSQVYFIEMTRRCP